MMVAQMRGREGETVVYMGVTAPPPHMAWLWVSVHKADCNLLLFHFSTKTSKDLNHDKDQHNIQYSVA